MAQKMQNPGGQAGASRDLSWQSSSPQPSTSKPRMDQLRVAAGIELRVRSSRAREAFRSGREAALMLLASRPDLPRREAGFLGHMCVASCPSDKQWRWLTRLLRENGLPSIAVGGGQ